MTPLEFEPIYQDYVWGGSRIPKKFHRTWTPLPCAESWEIADRPEEMSRVKSGPLQGKTLRDLLKRYGEKLLGRGRHDSVFPLLVKILDAETNLSIQVHPSSETAQLCKGEPKTECWTVLEGGSIFVGFKKPVSKETFAESIESGTVVDLLREIRVKPGQMVFIPGGRIHAVGAGCMIFEVQQNSNSTYRVYDWGRMGQDGKPRPMHLAESLQCIKFDDANDPIVEPALLESGEGVRRWKMISTLFFTIEKVEVEAQHRFMADPKTFQIFFNLEKGRTVLLPAESEPFEVGEASSWLRVYVE